MQVLSAALKAAQLDSPTGESLPELQPEEHAESSTDSLVEEGKSVEAPSESEESPTEEDQTSETPPALESSPVQEQGEEEVQTDTLEDQENCRPDSPVLV